MLKQKAKIKEGTPLHQRIALGEKPAQAPKSKGVNSKTVNKINK